MKVNLFDKRIIEIFIRRSSIASLCLSTSLLFINIPDRDKLFYFYAFLFSLAILYIYIWITSNYLRQISLKIDGTIVTIKSGDIFSQPGLKVISFNEYFDTIVDDKIIGEKSLNGIFLTEYLENTIEVLDQNILSFQFENDEVLEVNTMRMCGKKQRYRLGTIYIHNDYLLTAMSKFDKSNRATLTMPEYLEFLIQFWDRVNKVYAQKSVSTPIFGSGITRIKGHKNINDEELLKIMLWTFKISEMRFKYPAKLTIVIHKDKMSQVNLLDIKTLNNGI